MCVSYFSISSCDPAVLHSFPTRRSSDLRRRNACGHQPEQRLGYGNDLRVRRANVGGRLEEDLDDPEARIGDALDVLDVVRSEERRVGKERRSWWATQHEKKEGWRRKTET